MDGGDSKIDLGLLFENLVRDYRSFGLRSGANWARHTNEIVHWFAHQGMNLGFHVEQEFHYKEKTNESKSRRADLVWFRGSNSKPSNDDVVFHLESETEEQNAEVTIQLLADSPFPALEAVVAVLHVDRSGEAGRERAKKLCNSARKAMERVGRRMLLIVDAVWREGDALFGWVIEPGRSPIPYRAVGLKYKWRGLPYWDLKPD